MERVLKITLVFAIVMINFIVVVQAGISLGSVQVTKTAKASVGESVDFKFLVFNAHETGDLYITTDYEAPNNWIVSVNPSGFTLPFRAVGDRTKENGFEFLSTGLGDVKAKPVMVNVVVPGGAEPDSYEVKVILDAKRGSSGVTMSQSRSYRFIVTVLGESSVSQESEEEIEEEKKKTSQKMNEEKIVTPSQPVNVPDSNIPGILEENDTNQFEGQVNDQITDFTGMVISNPIIAPVALLIAALAFVVLRYFKRI